MLHELYEDHNQIVQLASLAQNTMKQVDGISNHDNSNGVTIEKMKNYINMPSADPLLFKLNLIVQDIFKTATSNTYGKFRSLNTTIVSNKNIQIIVAEYKELMHNHHVFISAMLNVNTKLQEK